MAARSSLTTSIVMGVSSEEVREDTSVVRRPELRVSPLRRCAPSVEMTHLWGARGHVCGEKAGTAGLSAASLRSFGRDDTSVGGERTRLW